MKTREELKRFAKEQIKGYRKILGIITIIQLVVAFILSKTPVGSMALALVLAPALGISIARIYMGVCKEIKPKVIDILEGFDDFTTGLKVNFLTGIYTILWMLLFIVPGIMKAFSYSMATYIVAENPGISAREALKKSQILMQGHRWEYFVLSMSFFGWLLVGAITLGIGYIWIMPYMQLTFVNYYNELKRLNDEKNQKKLQHNQEDEYFQRIVEQE